MAGIFVRKRTGGFLFGFLMFLVIGSIFSYLGYYMLSDNMVIIKNGVPAKATVVELVEVRSSSKSVSYKPIIEYTTAEGEIVRTQYSSGSNPPRYKAGDNINIFYSGTDPNKIIIDNFLDKYGFPAIFMGFGLLAVIIALNMAIQRIRYKLFH